MLLHHGTSERHIKSILENGIKPRRTKKGNWSETVESNPRAVYLTSGYALHFALNACRKSERLVVFEVDIEKLEPFRLAPDEDFLEQVTRKAPEFSHVHKQWPGVEGLAKRTRWFRARALSQFGHHWTDSIEGIGTCCYYGEIPATAITRYAVVPNTFNVVSMSDPTISLMNHHLMGEYYSNLMKFLFNNEIVQVDPKSMTAAHMSRLHESLREGVEVHNKVETGA